MSAKWWLISTTTVENNHRLHTCVDGRFVTIFRHCGVLSVIDSVCHHAGGPLTMGSIQDIEEIGASVVLCPWHKFMVSIRDGTKVYKGVDIIDGKPVPTGWKVGKVVQRCHDIREDECGTYVRLNMTGDSCVSDMDACKSLCAQAFEMHGEAAVEINL